MGKKQKAETDGSKQIADLLGRDSFVERVFQVADVFHTQKKTACYAINGSWGSGKTYILDKLETRLKEPGKKEGKFEFLVLRYNCWEYDYYDEPLLSIVATMLDALEQYQFSETAKATIKSAFQTVGNLLMNGIISYVDNKTGGIGTTVVDAIEAFQDGKKELLSKTEAFNDKLPFQKALKILREQIDELSKEHTVIFLVDELDRCLPEYAIRVLERLHHLFDGINNVQVIFSVDRKQLEHVVKELYGPEADTVAYLKKFISFELKLDFGTLNSVYDADYNPKRDSNFDERFASYVNLFSAPCENEKEDISEFKINILEGFDMRKRITLIEKAEIVHRIAWPKSQTATAHDFCVELFLTVLDIATRKDQSLRRHNFDKKPFSQWKNLAIDTTNGNPYVDFPNLPCFTAISKIFEENNLYGRSIFWETYDGNISSDKETLYGSILIYYRMAIGNLNLTDNPMVDFWNMLREME